jgi:uncharacterized NAD(P)/FAD-binding protein YdhS
VITRARGSHVGDRRRFPRTAGLGRERVIAIVGAGASGTLAAVHLLRRGHTRVVLVDPGHVGRGVAYSSSDPRHLLNVPACAMGGLADAPGDFLAWCQARGVDAQPTDYLPRQLYGSYLQELLTRFGDRARLQIVGERVEDVVEQHSHGRVQLRLASGRTVVADAAVLALGNAPPAPLQALSTAPSHVLVNDQWAAQASPGLRSVGRIVIIGSGLSAVDVALSVASANPAARLSAVSRHGWLPRAHLPGPRPQPRALELQPGCSLEQILTVIAREVALRPAAWREVIDGLRPLTVALWQGLAAHERERFERQLRPYWDIHRHRLAPDVAQQLRELAAGARLSVHGGGVRSVRAVRDGGASVELADGRCLHADVLVNATGPARLHGPSSNPLLRKLLANGRARPDELSIGLATSPDGALVDAHGVVSRRCFTLGPPRRGELLESTAVPEIRQQAAALASLLTPTIAQRRRASSAIRSNATSGFSGS